MRLFLEALIEVGYELAENARSASAYLITAYPTHSNSLKSLPPKYLSWLSDRYGESPRRREVHPFEDAIPTVVKYAKRDAAIGTKYGANEDFRRAVDGEFPPSSRGWGNPSDVTKMTVDQMERLLVLSSREKQRFEVNVDSNALEGDRIGKVGPWNLWLPSTREHSCEIAGYDKDTKAPKTTWCTARTSGENLFYSYVGRATEDIILFYVVRDEPKGDSDWLSLGFIDGVPKFGKDGGVSVDRANKGLTPESLSRILGGHEEKILQILKSKAAQIGGKHPAKSKMEAAAKSVSAYKQLTAGVSDETLLDLGEELLKYPDVSPEVEKQIRMDRVASLPRRFLFGDQSNYHKSREMEDEIRLIFQSTEHPEVRDLLQDAFAAEAGKKAKPRLGWEFVYERMVRSPTITERAQEAIIRHAEPKVIKAMAGYEAKLSSEKAMLLLLDRIMPDFESDDFYEGIFHDLMSNPRVTKRVLDRIPESWNLLVLQHLNPENPAARGVFERAIAATLSGDEEVDKVLFRNALSDEFLTKLASEGNEEVRLSVAMHRNAPSHLLKSLASDPSPMVRRFAEIRSRRATS
jgi:hypothetical protein